VILEGTFNYLVKKVRRQKFMNICSQKSMSERLNKMLDLEWIEERNNIP